MRQPAGQAASRSDDAVQARLRNGHAATRGDASTGALGPDQNGAAKQTGAKGRSKSQLCRSPGRKYGRMWWDEVPRVLQFNDWIASGYRADLSYGQCACTLFAVHNETGNIWLHFGPSFMVWALLIGWMRDSEAPHFAAFMRLIIPSLACLLLSTGYHLFMAQVKHYRIWLTADVCGVFSMFVIPFFTFTWWGYRCQPQLRGWVMSAYYIGAASAVLAGVIAKNKTARAAPMGLLSVFRLSSLAYRYHLNTSSREAIRHSALAELLCAAGAVINVLRIPERWLHVRQPQDGHRKAQTLDLWGNSHQIMHLLTAIAIFNMYWTLEDDAAHLKAHPVCQY